MPDHRLPKQVLHGELSRGTRKRGRPHKRWKDCAKEDLKLFNMGNDWCKSTQDRKKWRQLLYRGEKVATTTLAERARVRRERRHQRQMQGPHLQSWRGYQGIKVLSSEHRRTSFTVSWSVDTPDLGTISETVVSSANFHIEERVLLVVRSLIIIKKSHGPIRVPCGIPAGTGIKFEKQSELSLTRCNLFRKKSATQLTILLPDYRVWQSICWLLKHKHVL